MKKSTSILICATVIILALTIIQINRSKIHNSLPASSSSEQIHSTAKSSSSQENNNVIAMVSKPTIYVVKEYNGHIGVFVNAGTIPFEEIEVDVSSLPKTDQTLLLKGIKVTDQSKLNHILEDYKS